MTFKTTVKDSNGIPVVYAIVTATDLTTGLAYPRGTDGGGYADVDVKATPIGHLMSLTVQAGGFINHIEYPTTTQTDQIINVTLTSFKKPFKPAPRVWAGNMCGIRVPGAPAVPGGAADPSLILSWFYDRYDASWRTVSRANWRAKNQADILVSWPDSQDFGYSPQQFAEMCKELIANGFYPCPMLCAKPTSSADIRTVQETLDNIMLVLPLLVGVIPRACIGWELSLWLSPTDVQFLIDSIAPLLVPAGCKVYVHFQEGYPSFQQPGGTVADFWWLQRGKLTGLLYQKILSQNDAQFLDSISDNLQRFCGGFNMPDDNGIDGNPFDWVALELSAQWQFNGDMTEAQGDALGRVAINAPHVFGPRGVEAMVMGSGNGF